MKKNMFYGLGAAFCLAFGGITVLGQDSVPDHDLSEFTLGEHVSGAEVDLSKLKGKVVTIEYWGTR